MGKDGKDSCRVSATVSKATYAELERMAKKDGRSVSSLAALALKGFVEQRNGGPMLDLGEPNA